MKKMFGALSCAIALGMVVPAASAWDQDSISPEVKTALDEQLQLNYERYGTVGQSVVILRNNKPYYAGTQGLSNIELQVPVEQDHLFPGYSVTKLFTSVLVMKFVEEGKIDVNRTVRSYLSYLPEKWEEATVAHALNHTSGIPLYFHIAYEKRKFQDTKRDVFASLADAPRHFKLGTRNSYNNTNYLILASILEKVSGRSYQQLVREHILDPLKLENIGHASGKAVLDKMVTSYQAHDGGVRRAINIDWPAYTFSHSGLYSTAAELAAFMTGLVEGKIVKDVHQYWTPMKLNNGRDGDYAFGFEYDEDGGYILVGHDGGDRVKLRHYFSTNPEEPSYTLAYLTNGSASNVRTDILADSVMSIVAPENFKRSALKGAFTNMKWRFKRLTAPSDKE